MILSGDPSGRLESVANHLGIEEAAVCLPHQKAEWVLKLQAEGYTVLAVGDGHNDSVLLAAADVGMSLNAHGLVSQSADMVLIDNKLHKCTEAIMLGKMVVKIAKRGTTCGMSLSAVQMVGAATGLISPFQNAVLQEIVDLGCISHSLAVLWLQLGPSTEQCPKTFK